MTTKAADVGGPHRSRDSGGSRVDLEVQRERASVGPQGLRLRSRERPAPAPLDDWRIHLETAEKAAAWLAAGLAALTAIALLEVLS